MDDLKRQAADVKRQHDAIFNSSSDAVTDGVMLDCGHLFHTGERSRCGRCNKCYTTCCTCPIKNIRKDFEAAEKAFNDSIAELREVIEQIIPDPVPEKDLTKADWQRIEADKDNAKY